MQCSTLEGRGLIKATKPPASRLIQQTHCSKFFPLRRCRSQARPKTVDPSGRGVHHGQEVHDPQNHSNTDDPRQRDEGCFLQGVPDELTSEEEAHQRTSGDPPSTGNAPGISPEDGEQPEGHQTNGAEQTRESTQLVDLIAVPGQLIASRHDDDHGQNESKAAAQHWTPPLPEGTESWHGTSVLMADLPGEGAARQPLKNQ